MDELAEPVVLALRLRGADRDMNTLFQSEAEAKEFTKKWLGDPIGYLGDTVFTDRGKFRLVKNLNKISRHPAQQILSPYEAGMRTENAL